MATQFKQAVAALLQQSDPTIRGQANAWLEGWQQTPEAWSVCSEILEGQASFDAKYMAAQTLRTKVHLAAAPGRCSGPEPGVVTQPVS